MSKLLPTPPRPNPSLPTRNLSNPYPPYPSPTRFPPPSPLNGARPQSPVTTPVKSPLSATPPIASPIADPFGPPTPTAEAEPVSRPTPPDPPAEPWVHNADHPKFLPPTLSAQTSPAPLQLVNDLLVMTADYREFVDTIGKLELEYGKALKAAAHKLEMRLDSVFHPVPGTKKPPEPSVAIAMRRHLQHVTSAALLHQKRPTAISAQLSGPLASLERRGSECSRRFLAWHRDVRGRWDGGRERVDTARKQYHAAAKDYEATQAKFKAIPTPGTVGNRNGVTNGLANGKGANGSTHSGNSDHSASEWLKLERLSAEAEAMRAERKRTYLVALAGEGPTGGGGWDAAEGGGLDGWGEEVRAFYAHVHGTILALAQHQAREDWAHADLVTKVLGRAEGCYETVSVDRDEDAFHAWVANTPGGGVEPAPTGKEGRLLRSTSVDGIHRPSYARHAASLMRSSPEHEPNGNSASASPTTPTTTSISKPNSNTTLSRSSTTSAAVSPANAASLVHPALQYLTFTPPPGQQDEAPTLGGERQAERFWLLNRWIQSLEAWEKAAGKKNGGDGGLLAIKRKEVLRLRGLCISYSRDRGLGDPDETWEKRLAVLRDLGVVERAAAVARAELACLEEVLGPDPAPEIMHDFKERQYPTPATCDACGQNVWSPLKNERACRLCGIALHTKCLLHVDPECVGLKTNRRSRLGSQSKIRRSITSGALRLRRHSHIVAPNGGPQEYKPQSTHSGTTDLPLREDELQISPFVLESSVTEEPQEVVQILGKPTGTLLHGGVQLARVRHSYRAQGDLELTILAGEVLRLVEPDLEGLGWVRVRRGLEVGIEGLVPASYLTMLSSGGVSPSNDGGAGSFVVALFDFPPPGHVLGTGEIVVRQHHIYELSDEGMAFDDQWCELVVIPEPEVRHRYPGVKGRVRGVVPKTYLGTL